MKLHVSLPAVQIAGYKLLTHAYYHLLGDGKSEPAQLLLALRTRIYREMTEETSMLMSQLDFLETFAHSDIWEDGLAIYTETARA